MSAVVLAQAPPRGAIRIEGVVKAYGDGPDRVLALDRCDLEIGAGEICVVVGPSGCGKTTLLHALAGFLPISAGRITLDGVTLCDAARRQAKPGADRVVVFQNGALFPWKSTLDNVAFGPIVQGTLAPAAARDKARALLAGAGLAGIEHAFPGALSSGMRRRVEIARALMNEPKVLLLDEPFRALDALTKAVMHEALLDAYRRHPVTIFFITHDLEEAVLLGHKVVVMTARPARLKRVVPIDLPHPRSIALTTTKRFRELLEVVRGEVHEEARKAFDAGEREGAP